MVKLFDLKEQFKLFDKKINKKVLNVLASGNYILGENVMNFELDTKNYLQSNYTISCNSGTDALILSLRALNIGLNDEVITSPFTYFATAEAISLVGATPIFADINPDTFNINPKNIKKLITKKTKAVLSVNLFGQACELNEINTIARKNSLFHIEDCAQSFGAKYKSKQSGTFGDMGCYSFFPTKNLGCFGDGGLISVKSKKHYDILKKLRTHGGTKRNQHDLIGYNSRLDEIQAAILCIKLKYLNKLLNQRRNIAKTYFDLIDNDKIKLPMCNHNAEHTYNQFTVKVKNRNRFVNHLDKNKIPYGIYYSEPIYRYKAYSKDNYKKLPVAEEVSKQCVSLPIYPELSINSVKKICTILNQYE